MTAEEKGETRTCYSCDFERFGCQLLTIHEAAEFCKVSVKTIYNWMDRGLIEWAETAGGKRRIFRGSLTRQSASEHDPDGKGGAAL